MRQGWPRQSVSMILCLDAWYSGVSLLGRVHFPTACVASKIVTHACSHVFSVSDRFY